MQEAFCPGTKETDPCTEAYQGMSCERPHRIWIEATRITGNSITFCSCILDGTQVEQTSSKREQAIMWAKDIAASAGLILFMVSAFVLASGAHVLLGTA
jgi:hypothetical protein